ncbi:MAG: aminotransferase class III-fold pyridoxal phosphate-dependent enzyme [Kofleriaceae bacterium]|nr:aminotransferase class III-fold pyridoxal phosphate-dependent enzyme [Kofleriaceae bacterium]MCL4224411.1 aminotransferase class III-fold pyridoxal phosphate-dependent enzyme [Myxococcales bacterium]
MTDLDHPFFFTWTAQRQARPLALTGGQGAWFTTADGGRWLDLGSLSYQVNAGHGHRRIIDAIKRQADDLCLAAPTSVFPAKTALAEKLLELAGPGFSKVFFCLSGAEANENALKMARLVTGRLKLMSRYRSYHGASMGALSLTGDWRRPPLEPGIPGVIHVADCYCDRCPFGQVVASCRRECAKNIAEVMRLEGGGFAAVFLEPVAGANGVLVPPTDYWPMVRAACDADGALLVADEVLTGFGRTGKVFAHQHWGVTPDLITVAKGLASGYQPIGAVIVHERVARHFDERVLACGLTYYGHPTGVAAALETLRVYEDEGLYANAAALGPVLLDEVRAVAARLSGCRTFVRGLGLLCALEIEAAEGERDPAWRRLGQELVARRLSLHVDAARATAIFAPPLCIGHDELVAGVRSFGDAAIAAFGGN